HPTHNLYAHHEKGDDDRGDDAVGIGRFRIERVDAFALQRRHDVLAHYGNHGVEAILQAGKARFGTTEKNVFQHHAFVGRKVGTPLFAWLHQVEHVIFVVKNEEGVDFLFDLDVAAHGQIDDGAGDVAGVNGVVDQRSGFGGRQAFGRFVLRGDGNSGVGVASHEKPESKHHDQSQQRQKHNGVAVEEPVELGQ